MKLLYSDVFLSHKTGKHPECYERLLSLGNIEKSEIESGESYLSLVHTPEYIEHVKNVCIQGGGKLDEDTVVSEGSYNAAVFAVGAAILATQTQDFAVVRPPGHHAHPTHSGGFCIFNNMAIAAKKLVNEGKRILIIDIDSHLGDGTEQIFYSSNKVMYISLHQLAAYPGGGNIDNIGEGEGKGYTINIPLISGSGDDLFLMGINTILPIARQFSPDIVGISAGFDGHQHDPLLRLRLSVNTYYEIGKLLSETFPHLFAVLEGGYNLTYFPQCLYNFLAGINGDAQPYKEDSTESPFLSIEEFEEKMQQLKEIISPFWKKIS